MNKIILTVLGEDRPGIVADVTKLFFDIGCNLEDSSMTILEGEFAMLVIVSIPEEMSNEKLKEHLKKLESKGLYVNIRKYEVKGVNKKVALKNYIISVIGADKPGIVHQVSQQLADRKINITDVETKKIGEGTKTVYAMIIEAVLSESININEIEKELMEISKQLSVDITIKPIDSITI